MWILMVLSHWCHMEVFIGLYKSIISHFVLIINPGLGVIQFPTTAFLLHIGDMSLRFMFSAHSVSFLHLHWIVDQK